MVADLACYARQRRCTDPMVIGAFVRLLGTNDRQLWDAALHGLVTMGPVVLAAYPEIDVTIARAASMVSADLTLAAVAEACIRAGPAASDADVVAACGSARWTVALRAMAEVLTRPRLVGADVVVAARAALAREWGDVVVSQGEDWANRRGSGFKLTRMPPDRVAIRSIATMVLIGAGVRVWDDDTKAQLAEAMGLKGDDAANRARQFVAEASLGELALAVVRARKLSLP